MMDVLSDSLAIETHYGHQTAKYIVLECFSVASTTSRFLLWLHTFLYKVVVAGQDMLNVQSNTRSLETFETNPQWCQSPGFSKTINNYNTLKKDFLERTFTRNYSVNHEVSLSIPKNIPDNYGAHSSDLTGTHCSQGEVRGGPAAGSRITHGNVTTEALWTTTIEMKPPEQWSIPYTVFYYN